MKKLSCIADSVEEDHANMRIGTFVKNQPSQVFIQTGSEVSS